MTKRDLYCVCFFIIFFAALCAGCGHVISKQLREQVNRSLTVGVVQRDPEAYIGKVVLWNGEIINSQNLEDGFTLIEVLQQPAGFGGRPKEVDYSEGRFLVIYSGYLDVAIYSKGRGITAAGAIEGKRTKLIGQVEYTYPVITAKEIHLWPEQRYYGPFYPYYHPYPFTYPYPNWNHWRYDPYWYPWYPRWP